MGDKKRMDQKNNKVVLYTSQRPEVIHQIETMGIYFVKMKFIQEKYGEVAPIFKNVYYWYIEHASKYVPKPKNAESAIWAFCSPMDAAPNEGCKLITLQVPIDEIVFFDMLEWSDILNFRYFGSSKDKEEFESKVHRHGIKEPMDIVITPYYPLLKRELQSSWSSLFRYNEAIRRGDPVPIGHIQAGLWQIKKEWVMTIE